MPALSRRRFSANTTLTTALLTAGLAFAMSGCQDAGAPSSPGDVVDLALLGGRVVTLGDDRPEVEALAAKDGRIVAVGSRAEIEAMVGEATEVVELDGRLVIPGFVEAHAHFLGVGDKKMQLPLQEATTWTDIVAMVEKAATETPPGVWIRGRGWHQDKWSAQPERVVDGFPTHDDLSRVAPDHPVLLTHASGHAVLVNAKALELAGIDGDTPNPQGGDIVRDAGGEATGLLNETAEALVQDARLAGAASGAGEMQRIIDLASAECREKGITAFHDAGSTFDEIDALRAAAANGELGTRLWMMLGGSNEELAEGLPGLERGELTERPGVVVGGIKRYMDGALGSRGAWLLEPYSDDPDTKGLQLMPTEAIRETGELAMEYDLQLCVHAIGDMANREVLDLFEELFAAHPEKTDRRWRIEHAQHVDPTDLGRFADLGVVASVQSVHCTSDGPWVPERLGAERSESGAYMWRDLIDSGAVVVNGTDAPVEDLDPIANFDAAVTRRMANGEAFYPEQAMTRMEALRAMTIDAAWSVFQADEIGSLEVGKMADAVVLDRDILEIPDGEIGDAKVMMTVLGGEIVYRNE
ncbi:MAG: amidohydrolase [Acidobacteriota bacterium]